MGVGLYRIIGYNTMDDSISFFSSTEESTMTLQLYVFNDIQKVQERLRSSWLSELGKKTENSKDDPEQMLFFALEEPRGLVHIVKGKTLADKLIKHWRKNNRTFRDLGDGAIIRDISGKRSDWNLSLDLDKFKEVISWNTTITLRHSKTIANLKLFSLHESKSRQKKYLLADLVKNSDGGVDSREENKKMSKVALASLLTSSLFSDTFLKPAKTSLRAGDFESLEKAIHEAIYRELGVTLA